MDACSCPVCQSAMSPARPREVEAQRCPKCTGLWIDVAALEHVAGAPIELTALDSGGTLPCPRCAAKLSPVLFPGGIPVEGCLACRGLFLRNADDPQLVESIAGYPERLKASKQKATARDGASIAKGLVAQFLDFFR